MVLICSDKETWQLSMGDRPTGTQEQGPKPCLDLEKITLSLSFISQERGYM